MADLKVKTGTVELIDEPEMLTGASITVEPTVRSKIAKLIDVKTIITILFSLAFIVSIFLGKQDAELAEIVRIIIIFFFGTQAGKNGQ